MINTNMLSLAYLYVYGPHEILLVNARKLNQEVREDSQCFQLKNKKHKTTEVKEILHKF